MNKGWGTYQSLTLSSNLTKVIMRLIVDNPRHFSLPSYVEMQIQQINLNRIGSGCIRFID